MKVSKFAKIALVQFFLMLQMTCFVYAQRTSFVYLQTDEQQPFYVTVDGKNLSSSPIGYVILSKLSNGVLPIKIGFPNDNKVQNYTLSIEGNDQGFLIKNFGNKGWGLFNLQGLDVQMDGELLQKQNENIAALKLAEEKRIADSLAVIKSDEDVVPIEEPIVIVDTGLVPKPKIEKLPIKQDSSYSILPSLDDMMKNDEFAGDDTITIKIPDSQAKKQPISTDTITRKTAIAVEKKSDKEDMKFLDMEIATDSTSIQAKIEEKAILTEVTDEVIKKPAPQLPTVKQKTVPKNEQPVVGLTANNPNTKIVTVKDKSGTTAEAQKIANVSESLPAAEKGKLKKTVGLTSNNSNTTIVTVPVENKPIAVVVNENIGTTEKTETVEKTAIVESLSTSVEKIQKQPETPAPNTAIVAVENLQCKDVATEKDFYSLRKSMVMCNDADEMIFTAKKAFKLKCYSTSQLQNLCVLLLSDADRYSFLDAAYLYASDSSRFSELSALLKDAYYISRFKAMLK